MMILRFPLAKSSSVLSDLKPCEKGQGLQTKTDFLGDFDAPGIYRNHIFSSGY
jgi:hypothetical protein